MLSSQRANGTTLSLDDVVDGVRKPMPDACACRNWQEAPLTYSSPLTGSQENPGKKTDGAEAGAGGLGKIHGAPPLAGSRLSLRA
jgi:hypothetical protein